MGDASSFGGTVTGGIQDVSALLPLLGTEQCEYHVGSSLEGGYLYAAAAPLSIFGSLGIVKAGTSVLLASSTLSKVSRLHPDKNKWFTGAKLFRNAGFEPQGKAAEVVGMSKSGRFVAEKKLLSLLANQHIDHPEKLTVKWNCRWWNAQLVISAFICGILSLTPYIHLLVIDVKDQPTPFTGDAFNAWGFPLLRTLGSVVSVVVSQFVLQRRITNIMKQRIIFMVIEKEMQRLRWSCPDESSSHWFVWDKAAAAEDCLWGLEQFLVWKTTQGRDIEENKEEGEDDEEDEDIDISSPPSKEAKEAKAPSFETKVDGPHAVFDMKAAYHPEDTLLALLQALKKKHFSDSPLYSTSMTTSELIFLMLSLPASVIGYIGCFTLVQGSTTNFGPLLWLGLECALSILRIFIWATNPSWDEPPDIRLNIELSECMPMVTTDKDEREIREAKVLPLVDEREFLEHITSYTGPLERCKVIPNHALYYTLTGIINSPSDAANMKEESTTSLFHDGDRDKEMDWAETSGRPATKLLYLTLFDLEKRTAVVITQPDPKGHRLFYSAVLDVDPDLGDMRAILGDPVTKDHPKMKRNVGMFRILIKHYDYIISAVTKPRLPSPECPLLARRGKGPRNKYPPDSDDIRKPQATIATTWSVESRDERQAGKLSKFAKIKRARIQSATPAPSRSLHDDDFRYLAVGQEANLKSRFVHKRGEDITSIMEALSKSVMLDALFYDVDTDEGKWAVTEVRTSLLLERAQREILILEESIMLESLIHMRWQATADAFATRYDDRVVQKLSDTQTAYARQRLRSEKCKMEERIKKAYDHSASAAETSGVPFSYGNGEIGSSWKHVSEWLAEQWDTAIETLPLVECRPDVQEDSIKVRVVSGGESTLQTAFAFGVSTISPFQRKKMFDSPRKEYIATLPPFSSDVIKGSRMRLQDERVEVADRLERIWSSEWKKIYLDYLKPSTSMHNDVLAKYSRFVLLRGAGVTEHPSIILQRNTVASVADFDIAAITDPKEYSSLIIQAASLPTMRSILFCKWDSFDAMEISHLTRVIQAGSLLEIHPPDDRPPSITDALARNRRKWAQNAQESGLTSSLLLFTSGDGDDNYISFSEDSDATVMLYLQEGGRPLRMKIVHCRSGEANNCTVHLMGPNGQDFLTIDADDLPTKGQLAVQKFDIDAGAGLGPGYHELKLVIKFRGMMGTPGYYLLRDISVEEIY